MRGATIRFVEKTGTLTYEDLFAFPDDGLRREIINGDLIVSPSPKTRHQTVCERLSRALGVHVAEHGGGRLFFAPLDVVLSPHDVVEPDVFVVLDSQLEIITEANIQGAPALVIEVLSNPRVDRVRKRDLYERYGIPEYWIVDPDADRVEVYRLVDGRFGKPEILEPGEQLETAALARFRLAVAEVFAR